MHCNILSSIKQNRLYKDKIRYFLGLRDCYRYEEFHTEQLERVAGFPEMIQSELERYEENVCDYFKVKRAKKRVSEDAQQVGTNFIGLSLNFDFEYVFYSTVSLLYSAAISLILR